MGRVTSELTTYTCDRCKVTKQGNRNKQPSNWTDAWGWLKIDADAGWDYQGCAWAPLMRESVLLCGKCVDLVVKILNEKPAVEPSK